MLFYAQLRDHLLALRSGQTAGAGAPPVLAQEILQSMSLLSRGELSARKSRFVETADLR